MGIGHTRESYLVSWDAVKKRYQEKEIKIPLEEIKAHDKLERRDKTYGLSHLYEPLKRKIV